MGFGCKDLRSRGEWGFQFQRNPEGASGLRCSQCLSPTGVQWPALPGQTPASAQQPTSSLTMLGNRSLRSVRALCLPGLAPCSTPLERLLVTLQLTSRHWRAADNQICLCCAGSSAQWPGQLSIPQAWQHFHQQQIMVCCLPYAT